MGESLPVPAQLEAQLDKCKTVRNAAEYYKPRTKTAEVSHYHEIGSYLSLLCISHSGMSSRVLFFQEIKAGRSKLPPLPTAGGK